MKIYCESCGSEIPAANINLQDRMAKCESCNNIFSISQLLDGMAPQRPSPAQKESYFAKAEISLPKGISVDQDYDGLIITRKWFNLTTIFLTFFCAFWDGFMIMWFSISISTEAYEMAAFGSIHAIVGICLTYWCIASYINKTTIKVSSYLIKIKHSPLPFPGSKEFTISQLEQVYAKERVVRGKNGTTTYYDLYIIDGNKHTKVVSNLINKEQALYIEQEIEKYLDIEDRYVPGSVTG